MALKQSKAIERMYKALGETGHKSSLRLTIKVMEGKNERFFYDKGMRSIEDPTNKLSKTIVTGVTDRGRNTSDGQGGHIWIKKFVDIEEPRFLEDFIEIYGKRNVSIHEFGAKYEKYEGTIKKLLS